MKVRIPYGLLDLVHPQVSFFLGFQIIYSPLIRKDEHKWVHDRIVFHHLLHFWLDEDACERLHVLVLLVALILIGVEFLAQENVPVLPILASFLLLLNDFALLLYRILTIALITSFRIDCLGQPTSAVLDYDLVVRPWTELIHHLSATLYIRLIGGLLEIVVSHTVHGIWWQWCLKSHLSTWTHHSHGLEKLLSVLYIITFEIRNRYQIASDVFVHDEVIVATSWLFNVLRHVLRYNLIIKYRLLHLHNWLYHHRIAHLFV